MIGIYIITNNINNKVYIGLSKNLSNRIKQHKNRLLNNSHKNTHLQSAFNKYGINNFSFDIIEYCNNDLLCKKEKEYIKKYNSINSLYGYNKTYGGEFGVVSEESNKKRIEKLKLQTISIEIRQRISNTLMGTKQNQDTINKRVNAIRKCTDLVEQEIIKSYLNDNKNRTEIALLYNIKRTTVCSVLRRNNIKRKN